MDKYFVYDHDKWSPSQAEAIAPKLLLAETQTS